MRTHRHILVLSVAALALAACNDLPSWMGGPKPPEKKLPGERIAVLDRSSGFQPDTALQAEGIALAPAENITEWPQVSQASSVHSENISWRSTGQDNSATAGRGYGWDHSLIPSPVVGGGMVFAMDSGANITAHDLRDISRMLWESNTLEQEDQTNMLGGGLAYGNGKLIASSAEGQVAAIDAQTGQVLWQKPVGVPIRSAPAISEGMAFVVTMDNQTFAFDIATGNIVWTHRGIRETAMFAGSASPISTDSMVISPYSSGELRAFRLADGSEVWADSIALPQRTSATGQIAGLPANPVIRDGVVYATGQGGIFAANDVSNGRSLWEIRFASYQSPWIAGDYAYVISTDNVLFAIHRTDGRVRWMQDLDPTQDPMKLKPVFSGPLMLDGKLLVVRDNGEAALFNPDNGTKEQVVDFPSGVRTRPIVAGGKLILIDQSATLHVLE